jgi:hypothetical protein
MQILQCNHIGCLKGWYAAWEIGGVKWQTRIYPTEAMAEHYGNEQMMKQKGRSKDGK